MASYIKNIAIVGASGNVGGPIVRALLAKKQFNITAISREGSSATFAQGINKALVDYDKPETLVSALKGQDIFIITLNVLAPRDTQSKLVNAAIEAGVPWILPNEFGSYTDDKATVDIFGSTMSHIRDQIQASDVSSWIGVITGFWWEHSISGPGFYGFNYKTREAVFFDQGTEKLNTSTWSQVGRGVANLLSLPVTSTDASPSLEHYRNKRIFLSSFTVNQRDMFESLKRVTRTADADWKISTENSQERFDNGKAAMIKGDRNGFAKALYTRFFFPGEHAKSGPLANDILDLPEEDMDQATKDAIALGEDGYWGRYAGGQHS